MQNNPPQAPAPAPYTPQGQPYPPYPPQPPKQPMDPAKKKKLILGLSIGGGVVVLGVLAAIFLPMILRVDYSEAYSLAGELKTKVQDIYNDYDCKNVIDYADSSYTSTKSYNSYIENCRSLYDGVSDLADRLSDTAGVSRDSAINERYNSFRSAFDAAVPDSEKLDTVLNLRQAWHNFVVARGSLGSYSSQKASASDVDKAASYLINSGNDTLKAFGGTWAEKTKASVNAYNAYYNDNNYGSSTHSDLRNAWNSAKDDLDNYIKDNTPDIDDLAPLDLADPNKMHSEYNKFYELLRTTYQENYSSNSGDCTELFDEVYCD